MTLTERIRTALVVTGLPISGLRVVAQDNSNSEGRLSPRPIDGRMRDQITRVGEITAVPEGTERTGEAPFETSLGASVQGFPITDSVNGGQHVAVPTGLGGSSPRLVPSLIAPDISHTYNGNTIYAFAIPH